MKIFNWGENSYRGVEIFNGLNLTLKFNNFQKFQNFYDFFSNSGENCQPSDAGEDIQPLYLMKNVDFREFRSKSLNFWVKFSR